MQVFLRILAQRLSEAVHHNIPQILVHLITVHAVITEWKNFVKRDQSGFEADHQINKHPSN